MGKGPIISNPVCRLVTHKDYTVEMVSSIIKEMDLGPCGELSSEDLGVLLAPSTCLGYVSVAHDT